MLLLAGLSLAIVAHAEEKKDPKLKGSMKQSAPKIDLGLPTFNTIPTGEGMKKVEQKQVSDTPTTTSGAAVYTMPWPLPTRPADPLLVLVRQPRDRRPHQPRAPAQPRRSRAPASW
jgi:hypothetical protein